jgi:hypothetical protein
MYNRLRRLLCYFLRMGNFKRGVVQLKNYIVAHGFYV